MPSASPGEVGGEAISPSSLVLTWQPPPEDQLNGVLTGYLVNVTETETGVQYQISADTAQYTFEGLHPFYRYSFTVAASTIGIGPFSGIYTFQMPQDGKNIMFAFSISLIVNLQLSLFNYFSSPICTSSRCIRVCIQLLSCNH